MTNFFFANIIDIMFTCFQLLLKYTWGVKRWQTCTLVALGWTLPAAVIAPYTAERMKTEASTGDEASSR